jgi:GNAT superfamily N-acetyltransferase
VAPPRAASSRHLPLILVVLVLSFPGTGTSLLEGARYMCGVLPELRRAVAERRVLVARGGLGFVWLDLDGSRRWYLRYIASVARGRGVGSALLQEVLDRADARGATLVLHCPKARVRWYRRHGFLPVPATREARDRDCARVGCVKLRRRPSTRRLDLVRSAAPAPVAPARVLQAAGAAANCVA